MATIAHVLRTWWNGIDGVVFLAVYFNYDIVPMCMLRFIPFLPRICYVLLCFGHVLATIYNGLLRLFTVPHVPHVPLMVPHGLPRSPTFPEDVAERGVATEVLNSSKLP